MLLRGRGDSEGLATPGWGGACACLGVRCFPCESALGVVVVVWGGAVHTSVLPHLLHVVVGRLGLHPLTLVLRPQKDHYDGDSDKK